LAEELEGFISYIQQTWIGMVAGCNSTRMQPLFPVSTWNKYQLHPHQSADNQQLL
jgi:hypothetical protein